MSKSVDAVSRWSELDLCRESLRRRWESYAIYTLPHVCPDQNYNQLTDELTHDYQSVGSQAVNSLANKIMLALFAPSRPFFRADPGKKTREQLAKMGIDHNALKDFMAKAELECVKVLDSKNVRPVLFEIIKSLIVTGNSLMILGDNLNYVRVTNYVVKRDYYGRPCEIMTRACMKFEQLTQDVRDFIKANSKDQTRFKDDDEVSLYRWYKLDETGERFKLSQWVDDIELTDHKYTGDWPRDEVPARPLTWIITEGADYGTGLVEDYASDLAALSTLSTAYVQGSVLASEFRWLMNPSGQMLPEDVEKSRNGAVIPGVKGDLDLVSAGSTMGQTLQTCLAGMDQYTRRISQGFLMFSGVTRDAERVTAEEIRMQANELENSLGGAYSRLAIDMQLPIANWLMEQQDMSIEGVDVQLSIVTGLNALSRNGDSDNLRGALAAVGALYQQNPAVVATLKLDAIVRDFFAGFGLVASDYVKTQAEMAQEAQQAQSQQLQAQAASNVVDANTIPQQQQAPKR